MILLELDCGANMQQMTTSLPYLIRAFYDWIVDNRMTPYIVVDAGFDGVEIPHEYVVDGEIVLNLSSSAVRNLDMGLEYITFDARFAGSSRYILIPVGAVYAIYAKENGEGGVFGSERRDGELSDIPFADAYVPGGEYLQDNTSTINDNLCPQPMSGRPNLKIVK